MKNDDGFTIQELLVVLIVGSMLVGFSMSLFLFTNKLLASWQRTTAVREAVQTTLRTIALDVQKSQRIIAIDDTTCSIARHTGKIVGYRFDGRRVWRDDYPVNSDTTITMAVQIRRIPSVAGNILRDQRIKIIVSGKRKAAEYNAETDILLPQSSVEQFYASEGKKR